MAKTRKARKRAKRDVQAEDACVKALLCDGVNALLDGDFDTGRPLLRDHIKATVGFIGLGEATGIQAKSLIRMFGPRGNPRANNLFKIIGYLRTNTPFELRDVELAT